MRRLVNLENVYVRRLVNLEKFYDAIIVSNKNDLQRMGAGPRAKPYLASQPRPLSQRACAHVKYGWLASLNSRN